MDVRLHQPLAGFGLRLGGLRVQPQGLLVGGDRVGGAAGALQHQGAVVVQRGDVGLRQHRLIEHAEGLVVVALVSEQLKDLILGDLHDRPSVESVTLIVYPGPG